MIPCFIALSVNLLNSSEDKAFLISYCSIICSHGFIVSPSISYIGHLKNLKFHYPALNFTLIKLN